MTKWYTVIPLHNVNLEREASFEFGAGVSLRAVPSWLRADEHIQRLSARDREALEAASHAFVFEYDAASLGDPDPNWKGDEPRSVQESKFELGVLGNLALWLSCPSPVCFGLVFHAPQFGEEPNVQQSEKHSVLLCHPDDLAARPDTANIDLARALYSNLVSVERNNAIWTAIRASWAALKMNMEEVRYSLWWIALEALFGPEDGRDITYRLSQRIALFLGDNRSAAKELFRVAKKGYGFRSRVVHGRWKEESESIQLMAHTEKFLRNSLVRILPNSELKRKFAQKNREAFLDDLVFIE